MHLRASDDWSISAWLERHVNPECLLFSRIIIEIVQMAYIFMYITDTRSKLFSCGGFWSKAASKITYLLTKLDEKKQNKKKISFVFHKWLMNLFSCLEQYFSANILLLSYFTQIGLAHSKKIDSRLKFLSLTFAARRP